MDKRPVAVLDSGFGGLTILKALIELMPLENYLYFGDNALAPYGRKDKEFIFNRVIKIINFLVKKDVKLVVIACNTASVLGMDSYRTRFPKLTIVGVVPVVKKAAQTASRKSFTVLATTRTVESDYQKNLIKRFASDFQVTQIAADAVVKDIEEGDFEGARREIQKTLVGINRDETLVLGCTHFSFLKPYLAETYTNVLDSSEAVARQVKRILEEKQIVGGEGGLEFYTTGEPEEFKKVGNFLLKENIIKNLNKIEDL